MKKIILCFLVFAFTGIAVIATAQNPIPVIWKWKKTTSLDTSTYTASDPIKLTVEDIPVDSIDDFFSKTIIERTNKESLRKINKSLFDWIKAASINADSLVKDVQTVKKKIVGFDIASYLGTALPGDSFFLRPYVGSIAATDIPKTVKLIVASTTKPVVNTPAARNGESGKTVPIFNATGTSVFLPPSTIEAQWAAQYACCEFLTAPLLNKHTRWAITYDFNKQDPVAVWRRGEGTPGTDGCCGVESTNGKKDKGKKPKKEDTTVIRIAQEVAKLEKEWRQLEALVKDTVLNQRAVAVRKDMTALREKIVADMNEEGLKSALADLDKIRKSIDIIRAMNNVSAPPSQNVSEKGCCALVYCGIQAKRMAPTVKRSTLISVVNFHPYRDSFSLSIGYDDHFLQDMSIFNSSLATATGQGGAAASDATTKGKEGISQQSSEKDDSTAKGQHYFELFALLRNELKWYYTSKVQQVHLDVKVVENGVNHIKQKMFDSLGITVFTEAGIVKRAEEVADLVKKYTNDLNSFFIIAREAASWWNLVANYKIFDSKSVLVRNKDVMNIMLKRYTYGKLINSDEEASRSYYTSGGFKIDFSMGLFSNFLVNENFTTKSVKIGEDTTTFRLPNGNDSILSITDIKRDSIISDNRGKFNIGPAVYAHFYWRSGFDLNVSGTIGLAINQQALPRYLFGGSLLIGRDQRLVLTAGLACGPAKTLASGLKEGDKIQLSTFSNSTLPDKDVWRNSWFVGVSWNFAGVAVGK